MYTKVSKKSLLVAAAILCVAGAVQAKNGLTIDLPDADPVLRIEPDTGQPGIPYLSWDTEGTKREKVNLLRAPIHLRLQVGDGWHDAVEYATKYKGLSTDAHRYEIRVQNDCRIFWDVHTEASGGFSLSFSGAGERLSAVTGMQLVFPFDPRATATTVLPSQWNADGTLQFPAILSAPDFGQMLMTREQVGGLTGTLTGNRREHTIDLSLDLPAPKRTAYTLRFEPLRLPKPKGFEDEDLWRVVRRGWFNILQPSARWGDTSTRSYAPPGVLSNNVISTPVSCLLFFYGDHAFLVPELAPGVSATTQIRQTLDWWLDDQLTETGEMAAWPEIFGMLDANAAPLIAAWDYVESTGDLSWLAERIERLEFVADYLVKRDIDGDGLVEAVHSGNYGTQIARFGSSAYDTINSGHKDAYGNALIYRAWRCLADLEKQLGRTKLQDRYTRCADRLKAIYFDTLYDPSTGWLAWWRSEDGKLHNLTSPMINSLAIEYGLVPPEKGREILNRLWEKVEETGFERFDLGLPLTLFPVRKGDYALPKPGKKSRPHGAPEREDGTDTFGMYLNGGCMVSDAIHIITALQIVGEDQKANRLLQAMLERQVRGVYPNGGGFQNGIVDHYPEGAEFYTWSGETCGYEGFLTYSFSFLQAVFLRQKEYRDRLFRPLNASAPSH